MCMRSPVRILTPNGTREVPLNARVRAEVGNQQVDFSKGARIVLRVPGGAEVPVTSRGPLPDKGISGVVELVPRALLAAGTQYEVALIVPTAYPTTTVFGTFRTGTATDTRKPELDPLAAVSVQGVKKPAPSPGGFVVITSSCGGDTPHVIIDAVASRDPQRPEAQLLYGVWLGDAAGRIDVTTPPTGIFEPQEGKLVIGAASICHMDFPFPKAAFAWMGIAAVDEAGNPSAPRRLRIDLTP
jgi:hypothetical protein